MDYGKYNDVAAYAQSVLDAYDFAHTCRVLNYALQILDSEKNADGRVVILSAILHDLGRARRRRGENTAKPAKSPAGGNGGGHAAIGAERSRIYLAEQGYAAELAAHVADCIQTHSGDSDIEPRTREAKILFDADKLDKTGAIGSARAVLECRQNKEPLYALGEDGLPLEGKTDEPASLLRYYRQDLKDIITRLYTDKAKKIAEKRRQTTDDFFRQLTEEAERNHKKGSKLIKKYGV